MSRRRAVVHIGTMKTGTSTLQATLAHNPESLAAHGWHYLGWPMRTSERISQAMAGLPDDAGVIVSDEGLWHFSGSERSDTGQIAALLRDADVTIVVYFRRPDEFVESWFSQGLKTGLGSRDLVTFLSSAFVNSRPYGATRQEPAGFDSPSFLANIDLKLIQRLEFFETTFPGATLVVRPFERGQLVDGDIVSDFLGAVAPRVGLGTVELDRVGDANVSPGADTVLFASLLRSRYDVSEELIQTFLRLHSPPNVAQQRKTRILRIDEAVAINDAMRPVFREIQRRWGGGATDDFFAEWTIDSERFVVSELRSVYDEQVDRG